MTTLEPANVSLGASPASKEEAISVVASLLADSGHVDNAYRESMLGREKVANTYLGEGIAIPHGLLKDRDLIKRTGIAVVQVPHGLEWNPGEVVRLVVGIAATSDEHIQILSNLTQILADEEEVERLATTTDPGIVVERLSRAPASPSAPAHEAPDLASYASAEVALPGASGLHARPATWFVDVAKQFRSDVRVRHRERVANGKSVASLLSLGAGAGASVTVLTRGDDQGAALAALQKAIQAGLGEGEDDSGLAAPAPVAAAWAPEGLATAVRGIAASPGIAVGPLWHLKRQRLVVERTARDPVTEERRLRKAIESARAELRHLHDDVRARSGAGKAAIFRAHEAFLDDPDLLAPTVDGIRDGSSAGWAWREAMAGRVAELEGVDDPLLAARAVDLGDVGQRVLRFVAEADEDEPQLPDYPVVLVADDLSPSDTAAVDPKRVVGFCTALGGPTSHTAIIARALGIPAIVGTGPAALAPADDTPVVLDGSAGTLWHDVDERDVEAARQAQRDIQAVRDEEYRSRYQPAIMSDGHRVEVVANVNRPQEAVAAVEAGAEGVGLMRTEFLFLGRSGPPGEDEQYEAIVGIVEALNGLPLIVRTLDIGGDKNAPYLDLPEEDNSFLGMRGIRLCLDRPHLFLPQLRAIYRASMLGPVSVMFPMIARMEDLDAAMDLGEQARQEVGAAPIDVGIMVEVPSAALLAGELAKRVQFFSVGTNDLTQYTLAMDRLHPVLAKQTDSLHPAVLRLIKQVVDAASAAGIWVGVCGGVAGEPEGALILAGLGVRELSVSVPSVAAVKARLRGVTRSKVERLAAQALACTRADDVRALPLP